MDALKTPHNSQQQPSVNVLSAFCDDVMDVVTREEARGIKARGEGYFVNHGKEIRLNASFEQEQDRREAKGSMHEWETVHASELAPEQRKAMNGSGFLKVTTLQYQPYHRSA